MTHKRAGSPNQPPDVVIAFRRRNKQDVDDNDLPDLPHVCACCGHPYWPTAGDGGSCSRCRTEQTDDDTEGDGETDPEQTE